MLKLHGFPASNYYNMVKHALRYKALDFEEVGVYPGTDKSYLEKSPLGKIPALETENGFISETNVILEYLDERFPEQPLFPGDAMERAKVREAAKVAELYLELQARKLLPSLLMQKPVDEAQKDEVKKSLTRGLQALDSLATWQPHLLGEQFTAADIVGRYSMVAVRLVAKNLLDWNVNEAFPAMHAWFKALADDPISQQVDAEYQAGQAAFGAFLAQFK